MIGKPLLIALSASCLAIAVLTLLWQAKARQADALERQLATLSQQVRAAERARGIADMRAAEIARQLETHRAALAALTMEDIPDADLDPGVVAVLCSLRPDDPVCAE